MLLRSIGSIRRRNLVVPAIIFLSCCGSITARLKACEYETCTPNCLCDLRFDDQCAIAYGNYGWNIPDDAEDYVFYHLRPTYEISKYGLRPTGMRPNGAVKGKGRGIGRVVSLYDSSLTGEVYFEVHPSQLVGSTKLFVELYGNITDLSPSADCAETGTLLSTSVDVATARDYENGGGNNENFSFRIFEFEAYNELFRDESVECHPRSSGAVVATAEYTITDPFFDRDPSESLWQPEPDSPDGTKGAIQYCVRISVNTPEPQPEAENRNGGFSILDTKFRIEGDKSKSDFGQSDEMFLTTIYADQAIASKSGSSLVSEKVDMNAFPCGPPGIATNGLGGSEIESGQSLDSPSMYAIGPKYGLGDSFYICVNPVSKATSDFHVVAFQKVTCKNSGQNRLIALNDVTDELTSIESNTIGFENLLTNEVISTEGVYAVGSKITLGFVQQGDRDFVCSGTVLLDHVSERDRNLRTLLEKKKRGGIIGEFETRMNLKEFDPSQYSGGKSCTQHIWITTWLASLPVVGMLLHR